MNLLISKFKDSEKGKNIINKIDNGSNVNLSLNGVTDSMKAYIIEAILKNTDKSVLLVCSNSMQVNKLIQDLKFFTNENIILFPAKKLQYYDLTAESKEIENSRMYAIQKILEGKKNIVITTIDALQTKMLNKDLYTNNSINIKVGNKLDFSIFAKKVDILGYERSDSVEGKGQFSIRGGIIDIFPIESEYPYRIELFGDEIDNIRTFDAISQRSIDKINEFEISNASENLVSEKSIKNLLSKLDELVNNQSISPDLIEVLEHDIEKIKNKDFENILDKYSDIIDEYDSTLLDYLDNYVVYLDEPIKCFEKINNLYDENIETIKVLNDRNYLYLPFAGKYLNYDTINDKLNNMKKTIFLERINLENSINKNREVYNFDVKESNYYKSQMEFLPQEVSRNISKNKNVILVFPTIQRVEQVKNYLDDNKIRTKYVDNLSMLDTLDSKKVYITRGILSGGFYSNELNISFMVEPVSGINSSKTNKIKKSSLGQSINSYDDLEIGDYVVHEAHGIGVYKGIKTINVQSTQKDYIVIEYNNKGVLYVPITNLDYVTKYICDDDTVPRLNSLGGKEWETTRRKVVTHVKEMAKELMLLYAKRENSKGFVFSHDTPWQKEFEDSFEYELTEDQKNAVIEIKEDMEKEITMDRLLCGDVGYGKTEVALRATFKAVMDKKQVAYLVPTTVLALQQYRTFKSRMENFGVRVEMLSRMKSKKEQTAILKDLVDGKIDIIVGTHRILSKDVFFNDLGLLIIDEEHRFGVKAKESIKMLKETVDVLSMTATPIPRTLHMSMIGVRQMSTLTEPPMERLPVHTYVLEYDENVIKSAIEKELLRDGQVFYINNRVDNIEDITEKVRRLAPEAKVAYAHGQMDPHQIEDIMIKFINHELDVIVCTTILESGIDIPNANTIIIENSDKLGLAQLYQIRGRVGRSNRIAYAYITYQKNRQISEISEKRLKAISDFTEFGSGFKIALRDLEIRGAGNMLGREQHGHMAKVGYEMYLTLLERAIKEEKEGNHDAKDEVQKEVKIELNVSAYISDNYIKNQVQKISMYQRISDIQDKESSLDVIDELLDRYGDIPKETENLIKIVEIRNIARKLGITRIYQDANYVIVSPGNFKIDISGSNDILIKVQFELEKQYELFSRLHQN